MKCSRGHHVRQFYNAILQVAGNDRQRFPPPPLSTLEMQKKATSSLRIGGERVMKLAEELYQSGYISYPRTETDTFDPGYDLMVRITFMG